MRLFGQIFGSRAEAVSGKQIYEVAYDHVKKKLADLRELDPQTQVQRFENLSRGITKSVSDGELPINEYKNRYINVLPYNDNRVKLKRISGNDDYINASRIRGLGSGENFEFIATQAPIQDTIEDFWWMVLQENVGIVVMLTQDSEDRDGRVCRYYPISETETFGQIQVRLEKQSEFNVDTIVRQFRLENLSSGKVAQVTQYHYSAWPDHQIPSSLQTLLNLITCVQELADNSTVVVHCSAGIGRSGTFLTISLILKRLMALAQGEAPVYQSQINDSCNIEKTILFLRTQRMGLVQTCQQHYLCYQAIAEWLMQQQQS